jgi:hypothetical protein
MMPQNEQDHHQESDIEMDRFHMCSWLAVLPMLTGSYDWRRGGWVVAVLSCSFFMMACYPGYQNKCEQHMPQQAINTELRKGLHQVLSTVNHTQTPGTLPEACSNMAAFVRFVISSLSFCVLSVVK